jgi:hypothetical protein
VELSTVALELYGLPLKEFIAARNARASEARQAGDRDLAASVKRLPKPSTGASIVNLLVRKQPNEIERLIKRGQTLRSRQNLDGAQIRQATKDKAEIVTELLGQASSVAKREGVPLSKSVEQEIEATLDAAFSDPESAQSLREGCLTTTLHYSGLGFGADAKAQNTAARSGGPLRAKGSPQTTKAKQDFDDARGEADRAASEVERARRAVKTAEAELHRLRAALTVAVRRKAQANQKAAHAQNKLDRLRGTRPGRT